MSRKWGHGCLHRTVMIHLAMYPTCTTRKLAEELDLSDIQVGQALWALKRKGLAALVDPNQRFGPGSPGVWKYTGSANALKTAKRFVKDKTNKRPAVLATVKRIPEPTYGILTGIVMTTLYTREDGVMITQTLDGEIWESRKCSHKRISALEVPLSDGSTCVVPV